MNLSSTSSKYLSRVDTLGLRPYQFALPLMRTNKQPGSQKSAECGSVIWDYLPMNATECSDRPAPVSPISDGLAIDAADVDSLRGCCADDRAFQGHMALNILPGEDV